MLDGVQTKDKDDGRCRFNCRTAKENWIEGYICGTKVDRPGIRQEAENEWKRQRSKTG